MRALWSAVVIALLLTMAGACLAQEAAAKEGVWPASAEDLAAIKATLDQMLATAQAKDLAGITKCLHEKCAFWLVRGPQDVQLAGRDAMAQNLTTDPPPAGIAYGEPQAWVSGGFAFVSVPLNLPPEVGAATRVNLEGVLARTDGQWQVVSADLFNPELKAPALQQGTPEETAAMQQAFTDFQQSLMARGATFLMEAAEPEGAVIGWNPQENRLMVLRGGELQALGVDATQINVAPTAEPDYRSSYGSGVATMAANVDLSVMGFTMEGRLFLLLGYQPKEGKWKVYATALAPLPQK
jgi:hypothetical protein